MGNIRGHFGEKKVSFWSNFFANISSPNIIDFIQIVVFVPDGVSSRQFRYIDATL